MAIDDFNWKSLFINEEERNTVQKKVIEQNTNVFSDNKFPPNGIESIPASEISNRFFNEVLDVYNKGFESLNLEGFDFFELYKSVVAVGITNPQSYQMAFTMGKTIQPNLDKEFLLEKANFYISEIEKVYVKYDAAGKAKKAELDKSITKEKDSLSKRISDLEENISILQKELQSKKIEFQKMDPVNTEKLSEIQLKMEANDLAKHKILNSINTVVTGINQYL